MDIISRAVDRYALSVKITEFTSIRQEEVLQISIKPFLSRIEGISEVAVAGGKVEEYHVILDPRKLSNLKIPPQEVADKISESNFISSTGYLDSYNRLYLTLTEATQQNKNDLENLVIANSQKRVIKLKDIAKIERMANPIYKER